jgi:cytochrome P450
VSALGSLREPLEAMTYMCRRYGRFARLPLPGRSLYLLSDPELIEQVLVSDHASYGKDVFMRRMGIDVLGNGLLTSEGELWRRQRRLIQPAFHQARIAEYADLMVARGAEYLGKLRAGETRDIVRDMMHLTLKVVLRTLLSVQSESIAAEFSDAFSIIMARYDLGFRSTVRTVWGLPLPGDARFRRAVRRVNEIVLEVIRARRAEGARAGATDVLQMLLDARDEDGRGVTDEQLRDEVLTMFTAGHETTALALAYSFLLLSQHPEAERALSAELASVLGSRAPTLSDLPKLPHTEAVVLEAMRLYPPSYAIGREPIRDAELGGYRVPRGNQIIMSQWVLHRDPETFPEPEAFRPERWLDGLQKRLPRCAYMPFGAGPRKCIGSTFAMIEAPLLLATIAQRFRLRFSVDRGRPLRFLLSVTMRPRDALLARVEPI